MDVFDVGIVRLLGGDNFGGTAVGYQPLDKMLDTYYLCFIYMVTRRWEPGLPKTTTTVLFLYRLAGVAAFLVSGRREVLFFFPNVFEYFFLYALLARRLLPRLYPDSRRTLVTALLVVALPMFAFEYVNHVLQIPLREVIDFLFRAG